MKKLQTIVIVLAVTGAAAGLLVLGGCMRSAQVGQGYQSGHGAGWAGRGATAQAAPGAGRGQVPQPAYGAGRLSEAGGGKRAEAPRASQLNDGSTVVAAGTLSDLSGSLEAEGTEWYLRSDEARYALHFGNAAYLQSTGVSLREGGAIQVHGYVEGDEIAVVSVVLGGELYAFRGEDGMPLWAGRGRQAAGGAGRNRLSS